MFKTARGIPLIRKKAISHSASLPKKISASKKPTIMLEL